MGMRRRRRKMRRAMGGRDRRAELAVKVKLPAGEREREGGEVRSWRSGVLLSLLFKDDESRIAGVLLLESRGDPALTRIGRRMDWRTRDKGPV
jgi:hypothetical protein